MVQWLILMNQEYFSQPKVLISQDRPYCILATEQKDIHQAGPTNQHQRRA